MYVVIWSYTNNMELNYLCASGAMIQLLKRMDRLLFIMIEEPMDRY